MAFSAQRSCVARSPPLGILFRNTLASLPRDPDLPEDRHALEIPHVVRAEAQRLDEFVESLELGVVLVPAGCRPRPVVCDPEQLAIGAVLACHAFCPVEAAVDLCPRTIQPARQEGGLEAVLRQLMAHSHITVGVVNLAVELGQVALPLGIRTPQPPRRRPAQVDLKRALEQLVVAFLQHPVRDPVPVEYTDVEAPLFPEIVLQSAAGAVGNLLIGYEVRDRVAPARLRDLLDVFSDL